MATSPTTARSARAGRLLPRPSARMPSPLVAKAQELKGVTTDVEKEVEELRVRHTDTLREVNEHLSTENTRLKRDIEYLRLQYTAMEKDAEQRISQLEAQKRVALEKFIELRRRNDELEAECVRTRGANDQLHAQLADQESRLANMKSAIRERDAVPASPAVHAAAGPALQEARMAHQAEAARAAQLEALCRDLTAQRTAADRARDDALREVASLRKRVEELGRQGSNRALYPEPPPPGPDPEEHHSQLLQMQNEKNSLLEQLRRASALAAAAHKEIDNHSQARDDLLSLLQVSHPLALNMQFRELRQRYNVTGGLLLDLEDSVDPDAIAASSPWERLKWDVQQVTRRFQKLDEDRNNRILILQQLVAKTPAPSLDDRRELASAVLSLAGPRRGSSSLATAVDHMIALESEMQRLKKERTRAEERLTQLVHEHGSTIQMDPTDSRAQPSPGQVLLVSRLGAAEQRAQLLHAENIRLRRQLEDLSALIRA